MVVFFARTEHLEQSIADSTCLLFHLIPIKTLHTFKQLTIDTYEYSVRLLLVKNSTVARKPDFVACCQPFYGHTKCMREIKAQTNL